MKFIFFVFLSLIFFDAVAQTKFPTDYYQSPTGLNFSISSNFGEIRPNHFHAGLDVSTHVKSGVKLYAIADGYVSRVKVSPRGYGNAIYITHPNGYVSVYGHLSKLKNDLAAYVYKAQHDKQQFNLDMYPLPHLFPVKKGDLIGESGNSGRSYGAHLHFEIREQESEEPVNPLYVYDIKDNVTPKINGVYLYRFNANSDNDRYVKRETLKSINGRTIRSFGKLGFGLEIYDYISGRSNRYGVYQLDLLIDDSLYFSYQLDKFSFFESRYINSFIDYSARITSGKKITKCFIEPNNQLSIYKTRGSGIYDFSDGKLHKVKIIGRDIKGNAVNLNFKIQSDSGMVLKEHKKEPATIKKIDCFKENEFATDSFKITFHKNCLYHNIDFKYSSSQNRIKAYSKYHHIHNRSIPLHNKVSIAIKPTKIADEIKDKALIVGLSKQGSLFSVGGKWKNDFLEAKINKFGTYFVTLDTIKPVIRSLSINKSNKLTGNLLKFRITDNLSGIEEYIGYIDDKWVLFKYDEKNNLISCNLPKEKIAKGKHFLVLWVKDYCGNIASNETSFIY